MDQPLTVEDMYGSKHRSHEEVQALLDRSLSPRSSDMLFDVVASLGIGPDHQVLDIGARDARHSVELAARFGCWVTAVEPVERNLQLGEELLAAHPHAGRVDLRQGGIEDIPLPDDAVDLVWARDMLGHVADLHRGLAECARVLRPGGAMVIYETFAGPRMEPRELAELCADLATVPERMDAVAFEASVQAAEFEVAERDIVASEWREAWEEDGTGRTARQLLQAARLLRARDDLLEELGEISYRVELSNALWGVYQMIGKLEPRVYVLRAGGRV